MWFFPFLLVFSALASFVPFPFLVIFRSFHFPSCCHLPFTFSLFSGRYNNKCFHICYFPEGIIIIVFIFVIVCLSRRIVLSSLFVFSSLSLFSSFLFSSFLISSFLFSSFLFSSFLFSSFLFHFWSFSQKDPTKRFKNQPFWNKDTKTMTKNIELEVDLFSKPGTTWKAV